MEKAEAEPIIRDLIRQWAQLIRFDPQSGEKRGYAEFRLWLHQGGYSHLMDFRSPRGTIRDIEQWFKEETRIS